MATGAQGQLGQPLALQRSQAHQRVLLAEVPLANLSVCRPGRSSASYEAAEEVLLGEVPLANLSVCRPGRSRASYEAAGEEQEKTTAGPLGLTTYGVLPG